MQKTIKEHFTDVFGESNPDYDANTDGVLIGNEEVVSLVPNGRQVFGCMAFGEFTTADSYDQGTAKWERLSENEEKEHDVYVFDHPNGVVIDAQKIRQTAELLDESVETVLEGVKTHRWYPIVIPSKFGYVCISPIMVDYQID